MRCVGDMKHQATIGHYDLTVLGASLWLARVGGDFSFHGGDFCRL